jgi:ATP-dependent Clp protease protease subunit
MPSLVINRQSIENRHLIESVLNVDKNVVSITDIITDYKYHEDDPLVTDDEITEALNAIDGDVEVIINSRGGEVGAGLGIYNTLREYSDSGKGKVTTNVIGYAFSTAGWLGLAGDERKAASNALFMMHNPIMFPVVNSEGSLATAAQEWKGYRESISNIFTSRTGMLQEVVHNLMDAETFMSATEAKEHSIFTSITGDTGDLSVLNLVPVSSMPDKFKPEPQNVDISKLRGMRMSQVRSRAKALRERQ